MSVEKETIGKTADGVEIEQYTLTNANGIQAKIMTLGATLTSVDAPDRNGRLDNVTLSLNSLDEYLKGHPCLGSICGRYANRIANGRFRLDGREYSLAVNNGPNHLHGGIQGFDKVVWTAGPAKADNSVGATFTYQSQDGEEGYPGNLTASVIYSLTNDDELKIEYIAIADRATPLNLTNHAYWNLAASGDVLGQELMLNADRYLPVDATLIPLGELRPVRGTPMDFTVSRRIGSRIGEVAGGYDHCYVVNPKHGDGLSLAARLADPSSGRVMEVSTTQPGVQLYTANGLRLRRSDGVEFGPHAGVCLETQHFPDSPNQPQFPSTILRPHEVFQELTVHRFLVE
ncbi:MAG: galactose mutarotase [Pirellulales bacterium]|nr:galactose mutarotase [Pirellulales bacterium]